MNPRTGRILILAASVALTAVADATAGGLHHKHGQAQFVAVPVGAVQVQPQAATVAMSAVPVVQAAPVQMSLVQVPTVQMAVPQTVQMAVPQTVQMSVVTLQPQAAAAAPAPAASTVETPTFEVKIVQPQPAAAVPSFEPAKATPQVPSPQAATPQAATPQAATPQAAFPSTPQASFGTNEATATAAAGTSYLIYKLKPHRCHFFCKH